ncbi:MAG: paraquat-inducible protein A [Candidatus Omnitrophica bacterium]|nr:paraquat-inducible protein A [Candidatus Omnitrophota bacterium]
MILVTFTLFACGLCLPLFKVTQMVFWKSSYSILTGIRNLIEEGEYFLAGIIFLFSVIFPITKLGVLAALWGKKLSDEQRIKFLHRLALLGKWSMLDVLIAALTIIIVKAGPIASVEPRSGIYIFSVAIFLSMITTAHVEKLAKKVFRSQSPIF